MYSGIAGREDVTLISNQKNQHLQTLRGASISGVLLYHFDVLGTNGYLGVDIFFVLSGFLVFSKLMSADPRLSGFSVAKDFVLARFFRIYPALLTTVIFVSLLGVAFLSPVGEIQTTSKALCFSLLGLGNYFLSMNLGGYFDNFARNSPVLHLWSLSVELQAWTIMLVAFLITRKLRSNFRKLFGFFLVYSSLTFVAFLLERQIFSNFNSELIEFYAFSHRSYEFLLGVVAYLIVNRLSGFSIPVSVKRVTLWAIIGLLFIFPYSGVYIKYLILALSVLFLSISFLPHSARLGYKLAFIGDYAYLLYLVHWPILVIVERTISNSLLNKLISIIFTLISMPALKRIELKYLKSRSDSNKKNLSILSFWRVAALVSTIFIALLPGFAAKGGGFDPQVQQLYLSKKRFNDNCHSRANSIVFKSCTNLSDVSTEEIDLMLVGDSHAAGFTSEVAHYAENKKLRYFTSTNSGCPAISVNKIQDGVFQDCKGYAKFVERKIRDLNPKVILIAGRWANYLNSFPRVAGEAADTSDSCLTTYSQQIHCLGSRNTSSIFQSAFRTFLSNIPTNSKIVILMDYPEFNFEFENCERLYRLDRKCFYISRSKYVERQESVNRFFKSLSSDNLVLIDGEEYFCNQAVCSSFKENINLYYDSHHLNTLGSAKYFVKIVSPHLDSLFLT